MFTKGHKLNVGRKTSEETKEKQRQAKMGQTLSDEARRKISEKRKGTKWTPEARAIRSVKYMGSGNSNWKGGIRKGNGYIQRYCPDHPCCNSIGYVYEHRLVMEKHLGRYLSKVEEVHHIDKNKENNLISNLICFSSKSAHRKFENNIQELKPEEVISDGRLS